MCEQNPASNKYDYVQIVTLFCFQVSNFYKRKTHKKGDKKKIAASTSNKTNKKSGTPLISLNNRFNTVCKCARESHKTRKKKRHTRKKVDEIVARKVKDKQNNNKTARVMKKGNNTHTMLFFCYL
uniref:(northern house mosquito) hypothetical protein n=1 Tax=Culex pipiens TaxID=7175 RepID=A0A8D8KRG1_CULPI